MQAKDESLNRVEGGRLEMTFTDKLGGYLKVMSGERSDVAECERACIRG